MINPPRRKHPLQSAGAIFTGFLGILVLSLGTDVAMSTIGVTPPLGEEMGDKLLALAVGYRTVFSVAGCYAAAKLAPDQPIRHSLVVGALGLVATIVLAFASWNKPPVLGHEWYPISLAVFALPSAWLGGKVREAEVADPTRDESGE